MFLRGVKEAQGELPSSSSAEGSPNIDVVAAVCFAAAGVVPLPLGTGSGESKREDLPVPPPLPREGGPS